MIDTARRHVWNGQPGEVWVNDTNRVKYQLLCNWLNTCGFCAQYDHAIGPWWGIPLHFGCNCDQVAIKPGGQAKPFVDYREIIDGLDHDQQAAVMGASNYRLLKQGLVTWEDVVTPSRVRDLREVVARKKLTVKQMEDAGIKPWNAKEAHRTVHTPEHELEERHRRELIEKIKGAGVSQETLARELATRLASRVTIAANPTYTQPAGVIQRLPGIETSHVGEMKRLLNAIKPGVLRAIPKSKPPPPPPPTPPPPAPEPAPLAPAPAEAPEPTWAEKKARTIEEVTAQTEQPLHANPLIAEAQRRGAAAGVKTMVVDDKIQSIRIWGLKADNAAASYHTGSDMILINAGSKYWQQEELDASHARGWLATNDPNQIINHELGHWAHRHAVGTERFEELSKSKHVIATPMRTRIKTEVSEYASTSRIEFVAEVHAGLMAGKIYEPTIMVYYNYLGGVIPK